MTGIERQATDQRILRHIASLIYILALTVLFLVLAPKKAEAAIVSGGILPPGAQAILDDWCRPGPVRVAQFTWLSLRGQPTNNQIIVTTVGQNVDLDFNMLMYRCPGSTTGVNTTSFRVHGGDYTLPGLSARQINGISGREYIVVSPPNSGPAYSYESMPFTISTAGATQSGTLSVNIRTNQANWFVDNVVSCVVPPGHPGRVVRPGEDYRVVCPVGSTRVTAHISIPPPDLGACTAVPRGGNVFSPGQVKRVDYSATNSGVQAWNVDRSVRHRLRASSAPWPGAPTGVNIADDAGGRIVDTGSLYGLVLPAGVTTTWARSLEAPTTPGTYTFDWRIYGQSGWPGFHYVEGASCTMTIIVRSDYQITPGVVCNVETGKIIYSVTKTGTVSDTVSVVYRYYLDGAEQSVSLSLSSSQIPWQHEVTVTTDPRPGQVISASIVASPGGYANGSPVGSVSKDCSGTITYKPYFRAYGGDIIVGRQFRSTDGTCSDKSAGAELKGYSRQLPDGGAYVGAGSQLAISATGVIEGAISASLRNGLSGNPIAPPSGLTFGNKGGSLGADQSGYTGCMPNYYEEISTDSDSIVISYESIGGNIGPGRYYYEGDLSIGGDINVNGGGMGTVIIAVKGNIYIEPNVREINAILIAQSDPDRQDVTGVINTCSGIWADCTNKLTVNGAFSARKVYLNRINGTVGNIEDPNESSGSHNIAEVFNYRPLPVLITPTGSQPLEYQYGSVYDTIVGLPPVL